MQPCDLRRPVRCLRSHNPHHESQLRYHRESFGSKVDEQGALIARQQHQIEALTAGLKKRTISNRLMEQGTKNLMFHHRRQLLPLHFSERLRLETSTLNARNVRMPSTSSRARETRSGTHRSMPTVDVTTIDSTLLLRAPRI